MANNKKSGPDTTKLAAQTLNNSSASKIQRELSGSVLSQANSSKQTSSAMESKAAKALSNPRSAETTKTLAASVVSQSNKKR